MTSTRADVEVLEREQARLEGLLAKDANWRMLQDLIHARNSEQYATVPDRAELIRSLETVLSTNRYYLARRKIVEAIELLSIAAVPAVESSAAADGSADLRPAATASTEIAAALSRAQRIGIGDRMAMREPAASQADTMAAAPNAVEAPPPPLATRPSAPVRPAIASRTIAWPQTSARNANSAFDDFSLLRGLDPATIAKLHAQSINRFAAIAAWTASDVARLSAALANDDRIARDGWIEQAAVLATGCDTAFSGRIKRGEGKCLVEPSTPHEGEPGDRARLFELTSSPAAQATAKLRWLHLELPAEARQVRAPAAPPPPATIAAPAASEAFLILADHDAIRLDGLSAELQPAAAAAPSAPAPFTTAPAPAAAAGPPVAPALPADVTAAMQIAPASQSGPGRIEGIAISAAAPASAVPAPFTPAFGVAPSALPVRSKPPAEPVRAAHEISTLQPAAPVMAETTLERLARLEQDVAELDAPEASLQSRLAKAVAVTTGLQQFAVPPAPVAAPAKQPSPEHRSLSLRHIEDEEFPQLRIDEADVEIRPSRHAEPMAPATHRSTNAMLKRQRQAEQQPVQAHTYAGYQTEVEEASVEIVRRTQLSTAEAESHVAGSEPFDGVRASKGSVQRFLKSLGNK